MGRKLTNKAKAYMVEYQKANVKQIKFTLNYNTDEDMIAYLETVPNKNAYLKELVRADMERKNTELIEKLYDHIGISTEGIQGDRECGYLTENTGRDGKDYFWYLNENHEAAIRKEDGKIIDEETIKELFC